MCSAWDNVALPTLGFPIRASAGHWLFSASPRLFAAVHALHRLLVPRHPPYALTILTVISGRALGLRPVIPVSLATVQFSRSATRRTRPTEARDLVQRAAGGEPVSQNSTARSRLRLTSRRSRATRQVRSTFLVPIALRRAPRSSEELETTIRRRSVPCWQGSLERR